MLKIKICRFKLIFKLSCRPPVKSLCAVQFWVLRINFSADVHIRFRKCKFCLEKKKNFFKSPGSYFVRSVYKEYSFDPPTQMVEVGEGKIAELKLIGKRVAYSCFSKVRTLNGQPVSEISVEAIAANCDNLQEESVTEVDGSFRIRGLKPGCNYQLKFVKKSNFLWFKFFRL